jgi:two-component system sensor histidine kinase BaeS
VAGIALLLAAIVAFLMAHRLLAPIRRLASGDPSPFARRFQQGPWRSSRRTSWDSSPATFNRLAATLRDADEARRGFLADISHDLRHRLPSCAPTSMPLHDGCGAVTPQRSRPLHTESPSGHLVNDLYELAVSDLGPADITFERSTLRRSWRKWRNVSPRMAARNLALDTTAIPSTPASRAGESRRLRQASRESPRKRIALYGPGGTRHAAVREERGESW